MKPRGEAMAQYLLLLGPLLIAADWPVSRGNSAATGVASAKFAGELKVAWEFPTKNAIEGTPAIVNGIVYIGSTDKHVYAVDLVTGKQVWKTLLGSPIKASVGVHKGRLYVGDVDAKFHCLDTKDGKKLWTFEAEQEIVSGCNFHGDRILFGSNDGRLYCLNSDKSLAWNFGIDQPINGSPSVANDLTFVAGCDEVLHIVDLKTGRETGKLGIGGPAGSTAAFDRDTIYVGTMSNQVLAIDVKNPKEPKELWRYEAKNRQQPYYSSAALSDSLVVIGSRDKRLHAIDRQTGTEKWTIPTDGMIDGNPVIVGDTVYFGTLDNDGWLYCADLKSGKIKQKVVLDSTPTGSPAVAENRLLIGTEKGTLYCLVGLKK